MKKTILPTFLGNRLNFELPKSWNDFTQEQLRYVFFLMATFPQITAQAYLFFRLLNIKVHCKSSYGWVCSVRLNWHQKVRFFMQEWEVQFWQKHLNWLYSPTADTPHLKFIDHHHAVSGTLHGVSFEDYLKCENYYQGYLYSKNEDALRFMGYVLYPDHRKRWQRMLRPQKFKDYELFSIFLWWSSVKQVFSQNFPDFFQRIDPATEGEIPNMMAVMNAQIRALSGGDITKEHEVLNMDCWRALTELNEKAREVKEQKERMKK